MSKLPELLIFPCNGNGLEVLDCIGNGFQFVGFVDDTLEKQALGAYGHPVYGRDAFVKFPKAKVLAVPGNPASYITRKDLIQGLGIDPLRFATLVHPHARVSTLATLGLNVVIMAGAVITANAVIGSHVCILPNTVIHHDVTVGDWTLVGSNVTLAGGVTLEDNCYIGSGTSVMNGLRIGRYSLVGIGSNVIRDVGPFSKAVGNPARVISVSKPTGEIAHAG